MGRGCTRCRQGSVTVGVGKLCNALHCFERLKIMSNLSNVCPKWCVNTEIYAMIHKVNWFCSQTEFTNGRAGEGETHHYQTDAQKMSSILSQIAQYRWSIGKFLLLLLDEKYNLGGSAVKSFLSGTSNVRAAHIINAIYNHWYSNPPTRHDENLHQFSPSIMPNTIRYAGPAISSWALQLVLDATRQEVDYLCTRKAGPRAGLRARAR
jgi:hypothetical protein